MKTTARNIKAAGGVIARGGLVAFPTETVYGLGANALDARAVAQIFLLKGRPSDNPLIVHIASMSELAVVARDVPDVALKLMRKFWPGPLTFVLRKTAGVPSIVTAGGSTIAVRMPANKIALALIKAAGCPVAAPSANLAGKPSPTLAAHVAEDFGDKLMILDGGKTLHGLESTVIDVTGVERGRGRVGRVEILRSGAVTAEMLSAILGYVPKIVGAGDAKVRSPGMKYKHYAPSVPMILIGAKDQKIMVAKMLAQLKFFEKKNAQKKIRVGILCVKENAKFYRAGRAAKIITCGSKKNPASFGRELYAALRKFNKKDVDVILAENCGKNGVARAVFDRLSRAATEII